jgi:methanogenic corrinoid protein MtbC1
MLANLDSGLSAAEGARLALAAGDEAVVLEGADVISPGAASDQLRRALDLFDEPAAHAALDRLLSTFTLETVLRDAVLPYLHELGERWQNGEASIAQEHFASVLLRGRLLGLARGWGSGGSRLALLACLPGEQHDLGLICFGLALRGQGWWITFLGPDTPLATIAETTRMLRPALVVVTATTKVPAATWDGLADLGRSATLAMAGTGTGPTLAEAVGAEYLDDDPVSAAIRIAARAPAGFSST